MKKLFVLHTKYSRKDGLNMHRLLFSSAESKEESLADFDSFAELMKGFAAKPVTIDAIAEVSVNELQKFLDAHW